MIYIEIYTLLEEFLYLSNVINYFELKSFFGLIGHGKESQCVDFTLLVSFYELLQDYDIDLLSIFVRLPIAPKT